MGCGLSILYAKLNSIPMLVVLDNCRRVGIALGKMELVNLLGIQEICWLFDLRTGERVSGRYMKGSKTPFHVLTPQTNQHVSAIAVNLPKEGYQYGEPPGEERLMRLRVLHNPYATVPLEWEIFNDPEDGHFGLLEGEWVNIPTGRPLFDM
jgi:hypothetical protein